MYKYYLKTTKPNIRIMGTTGKWRVWKNEAGEWELDIECKVRVESNHRFGYVHNWVNSEDLTIHKQWVPEYKVFSCTKT